MAGELAHQQTEEITARLGLDGGALLAGLFYFISMTRIVEVLPDDGFYSAGKH